MPEIPELELLRRDLEREVGERKIKTIEVQLASLVKRPSKKDLIAALEGKKLTGVTRQGMLLLIGIEGEQLLVISMGDATRMTRNQPREELAAGTAAVISFTQGGQLRIIDPAKEATMELIAADTLDEVHPELINRGFDPVDEPISWITFGERLMSRDEKLKTILMDQTVVVGIGAMYSDEILFHSGLRFDRLTSTLSAQEVRRLYRSLVETVHEALKYGGTTLGEDGWVGLAGTPGDYGQYITVYKRDGEMSPRARGPIVKARFGRGYTYFCEQTQV
ncbi:MAG TPA: DNA-formamidopyrimidine glycosylase family protein [Microthrixaceae bacterium]|nr:DNA-formamidopyrimidine glycosylase family protein [Microthrixaceae bacterium]